MWGFPMRVACLHTADSNIAAFEAARRELGRDGVALRHVVRADLLEAAERAGGLTAALAAGAGARDCGEGAAAVALAPASIAGGVRGCRAGRPLASPIAGLKAAVAAAAAGS